MMKRNIIKLFSLIGVIFSLLIMSSCQNSYIDHSDNSIYLNERVILLEKYEITVTNVETIKNSIFVLKNKEDTTTNEIYKNDKNFIKIVLDVSYQDSNEYKNYKFDKNDFKLKNYTGTKVGNNLKDNYPLVEDYTWMDTEIAPGSTSTIILYFEVDNSLYIENEELVLEIDFSRGIGNHKDIILTQRKITETK